ncbi:gap junction delta-4 protein-like [Cololabis saira]|uniref:gap junction delta-4 protein-like n=1 Tax=Cololabis saira TaxID=129043 RepID=UPI002AD2266B|nr:gap junction delta-4 protein-like [Cololabis saira]
MRMMEVTNLIFIIICQHVPFIGKTWWILALLLRLLVLLLLGFTLFSDEQDRFICNTIQPGCSNVCFDVLNPVSLLRLWLLHFILLCVPHLMFAVYIVQKVVSFKYLGGSRQFSLHGVPLHDLPREWGAPHFYLLLVFLRILLEAFFIGSQCYLFGLTIPKSFLCYESPCTSGVECYVSRPTEKNFMLNFMLAVSSLSILLSSADLVRSVKTVEIWRRKRAMLMEEMSNAERISMLTTTTVMEDGGVLLTKRNSPTVSSKTNSFKDEISIAHERNVELLNGKMHGGSALESCESATEISKNGKMEVFQPSSPFRYSVRQGWLKSQRDARLTGVKSPILYPPYGADSGHQSACNVLEDRRAWV